MEIVPGLHWVEAKSALGMARNMYLWSHESGLLLVDTGMPGDEKTIFQYLASIGQQPENIRAIAITHADIDHAGSAAAVLERSGATVFASPASAKLLRSGKSPARWPRVVQSIVGRVTSFRPLEASAIQALDDGESIPGMDAWTAVATPGHSPDHLALYSGVHGVLFAGDALTTRSDKLGLMPKVITADIDAAQRSAMRLLRRHPAVIACGHGRPLLAHDADLLMTLYRQLQDTVQPAHGRQAVPSQST